MSYLIEILKNLSSSFLGEIILKLLPFFGAGFIAALIVIVHKSSRRKSQQTCDREKIAAQKSDEDAAKKVGEKKVVKLEPEKEAAPDGDKKPFEKIRKGLAKSRSGLLSRLEKIVSSGRLSEDLWSEFEETLVLSDTGVSAAQKIRRRIEKQISGDDLKNFTKIKAALISETADILKNARANSAQKIGAENIAEKPAVFMLVGVNGTGKTTTAGKLAARIREKNKSVMLTAADTFRAAASEQLEAWARKTGAEFLTGKPGSDPSGVAFDAVKSAAEKNCDAVIIDTAGRLHTKTNLMDELSKIKRVIGKALKGAPHETLLVLDATTGQNAVRQTEMFDAAVGVTGIVLTKLDGTAKGGAAVAVAERFRVPVVYAGTGEKTGDLADFEPEDFARALFDETN